MSGQAVPQSAHRDPTARALHEVCDALQVCTQEAKDSLEVDFQVLQEDGGHDKGDSRRYEYYDRKKWFNTL